MLRSAPSGRVAVGHPVDVASGDFFATHVDVEQEGLVPLALTRHYNSSWVREATLEAAAPSPDTEPFGSGFRASWDVELRQTLEGFVFTTAEGASHTFTEPRERGKRFQDMGRILAPDNHLELSRVDADRLRVVRYGVDRHPFSHVFLATGPGGPYVLDRIELTAAAFVQVRRDAGGRVVALLQSRERRALELEWSGPRVVRAVLRYADTSALLAAEYAYDTDGLLVAVHDRFGVRERYAYDGARRVVSESKRSGSVYTIRYDGKGRCNYVSGSGAYQERSLRWDDAARQCFVRDSHGATTVYAFNEAGQVLLTRTPTGNEERTEIDNLGRVSATTLANGGRYVTEFDDVGHIVAVVQPDGTRTTCEHDAEHRLIALTDEAGYRVALERGPNHVVSRVLLPSTPPWLYDHNAFGELVRVTDPKGASRVLQYDDRGCCVLQTDFRGNAWEGRYDRRGRLTAARDPLGGVTQYQFEEDTDPVAVTFADGRTWAQRWNVPRTELTVTRPDGRTIVAHFSECGLLTDLHDEDACITRLFWDTEPGRLLRIVNGNGDTYSYAYDDDGNVLRHETFDGRVFRQVWSKGLVLQSIGPSGRAVAFAYDAMGRVLERRDDEGISTFTYDARGNVTSATSPAGVLVFTYDEHGQRVTEAQESARLSRTYDTAGMPSSLATNFGPAIQYAADANGDVVELRYGDVHVPFERDALGREVRRSLPGVGVFEQALDPAGRLLGQRLLGAAGGSALVERAFAYDAIGNLTVVRDSLRGVTELLQDGRFDLTAAVRTPGASEFSAYDRAANRIYDTKTLQGREALARAAAVGFDRLFTIAEELGGSSTGHTYGPGNRLLRSAGRDRIVDYAYDADGQVTHRRIVEAGRERTLALTWDARGQLAEARLPDGAVWRYRYDPLGRRCAKIAPDGRQTTYVWDGYQLLSEARRDGTRVTWPALPGSASPVLVDDGAIAYVLPDATGAPSEVIAPAGVLRDVLVHGTWGECAPSPRVPVPFVGHYVDEETGLHYNVFRYYDPLTGRFLSPDPIGLSGGINEYAGVPDPFSWIDPEGLTAAQLAANMADARRPLARGQTAHHIVEENRNNVWAQRSRQLLAQHLDYSGDLRGGIADHPANGARLWGIHPNQRAQPGHPGRDAARAAGTQHAGRHIHGAAADRIIYLRLRAAVNRGDSVEAELRRIGRAMENGTWRDSFNRCRR